MLHMEHMRQVMLTIALWNSHLVMVIAKFG